MTAAELAVLSRLAMLVAEHLQLRVSAWRTIRAERDAADGRTAASQRPVARLRAAAATLGDTQKPATCQLGGDTPCPAAPEAKVADSWGDSAWGCLDHIDDVIPHARSVFIADAGLAGLSAYLGGR